MVIPTGSQPPNPGDFVASPAFTSLIRDLEAEADLVILDAPPVRPVSDALSIGRQVDAVIVVVKAGSTTRDQLIESLDSLRQVGADVIGVCVVGIRLSAAEYSQYGYTTAKPKRRHGPRAPANQLDGDPVRSLDLRDRSVVRLPVAQRPTDRGPMLGSSAQPVHQKGRRRA